MPNFKLVTNHLFLWRNLVFYLFLLIFAFSIVNAWIIREALSKYVFDEWLINYSHGFVRRGLVGTFLMFIHDKFYISIDGIRKIILHFSYIIYCIFSIIYITKVNNLKKQLSLENLVVFLFLPCLIVFPIRDLNIIGRKDFFFLFGLAVNLFFVTRYVMTLKASSEIISSQEDSPISNKEINKYCYSLFIWFNLLSIPTALIHEAIIFLGIPLNMMITGSLVSSKLTKRKSINLTLAIYLPTILVAVLCMLARGNEEIAVGICNSWHKYSTIATKFSSDCITELPNTLKFFNISNTSVIKMVIKNNIRGNNGLVFLSWLLVFSLNVVILIRASYTLIKNSVEKFNQKLSREESPIYEYPVNFNDVFTIFSFKYLFIPFIFSLILYVSALDWGRWFFIISVSYALCVLSPSLLELEIYSFYRKQKRLRWLYPIYSTYSQVIICLNTLNEKIFRPIYLFILIYTILMIRIPHYRIDTIDLYKGRSLIKSLFR
ncbi:MAG: hypothetical protein Cpurp_12820 [Chlorogloea purpurea SAG 13.99]|nr:hypothetical protein [Chlorogloea purpurea SAG 13.99]